MSALVHRHATDGVFAHALALVTAGASGLVREWQVRRDTLALSELGEAALHDIGVGRGFEEAAVRNGRGFRARSAAGRTAADAALMPASWTEWR